MADTLSEPIRFQPESRGLDRRLFQDHSAAQMMAPQGLQRRPRSNSSGHDRRMSSETATGFSTEPLRSATSLAEHEGDAKSQSTPVFSGNSQRSLPSKSLVPSRLLPLKENEPNSFADIAPKDHGKENDVHERSSDMDETRYYVDSQRYSSHSPSDSGKADPDVQRVPVSAGSESDRDKVLKLSPSKIQELTSSPESLPVRVASLPQIQPPTLPPQSRRRHASTISNGSRSPTMSDDDDESPGTRRRTKGVASSDNLVSSGFTPQFRKNVSITTDSETSGVSRRLHPKRTVSSPPPMSRKSSHAKANVGLGLSPNLGRTGRTKPSPLLLDGSNPLSSRELSKLKSPVPPDPTPSPMPASIPLPPLSIATYLQLELAASRPSPLYIHRSVTSDFPYESSKIKFERLLNFLLLPPQLEAVLWFGALACADAWLYTFTILPLRFFKALGVLCQWWGSTFLKEASEIARFIYWGLGRMWQRHNLGGESVPSTPLIDPPRSRRSSVSEGISVPSTAPVTNGNLNGDSTHSYFNHEFRPPKASSRRHRRTKSTPSALLPNHKADLLKGLLVLFSCLILMRFDASRMYHSIRGQAAIKLYVIYNVLECCDRLFSALGQDVFECLFSRETLERKPDGRSKLLRPFGMFLLALSYNVIHSTALFYQVITLNVAVNSYSNALLTLLMSNQFVEIKSTVFKKFEKENLFQLTCADVVERFQLSLMLLIIALRNIVEVGGLSLSGFNRSADEPKGSFVGSNASSNTSGFSSPGILPKSFTIFPIWTGQVLGPFLLVLGSEMLVDWLKHAYITKFNNTKPSIYGRFLDVLAKDYYSNAFADQNLTRRLGLPVIPLSCLFIRASIQTYHMLLATHLPYPIASPSTSLLVDSSSATTTSPATTAALAHLDTIIRRALGRSSFGAGSQPTGAGSFSSRWFLPPIPTTVEDAIAFLAMSLFFLGIYLVLLATKLVLGMALLGFARARYKGMKEREREIIDTGGRRIGGWGVVEVDDDKKRWIYLDDPEGGRAARERERVVREKGTRKGDEGDGGGDGGSFGAVSRYTMVAKRIW
ncbi:MAG: hypothetical protein M1837_005105 [Sclerophora amabilis]|nr:MAG: hypothetical protein M1837_005105 [Sclerophora amabilis]